MVDNTLRIGNDVFTVSPLLAEASFLLQPKIVPILPDVGELYGIFTQAAAAVLSELKAPPAAAGAPQESEAPAAGAGGEGVSPEQLAAASQLATEYVARASAAVARLCAKLPPDELRYIMRTLLQGATMNGAQLYTPQGNPIDVLLRGRTLDVWRLLIHAVKVSYPDFFGLADALRARVAAAKSSAK